MQNLKNKKKITSLMLTFLLVFVVGTAFAFTSGTLDIEGRVHVSGGYVKWLEVEPGPGHTFIPATSASQGVTMTTAFADARGRTDQTIVWNMYFTRSGTAEIVATAINDSSQAATITYVNTVWNMEQGMTLASFGLSEDIIDAAFVGVSIPAGGTSGPLMVEVEWNGTIPAGFVIPAGETYALAGTATITFGYAMTP